MARKKLTEAGDRSSGTDYTPTIPLMLSSLVDCTPQATLYFTAPATP